MENKTKNSGKQSSSLQQDEDNTNKSGNKATDLGAKYAKWDKLAKEMEAEEENEEGEVDKLFKKIYRDSSDEVKKAMIKSFTESSGTVLSTNWNEVKKERIEMKPPEGSEFKKYEK